MKITITEEQYNLILETAFIDKVKEKLEQFKSLTEKIISDLKQSYNFHIKFGLTYGAGIGAVLGPITNFLHGRYPEIDSHQINMLAVAAIMVVFFENKKIEKIEKKISEENLENELAEAVNFTSFFSRKFSKFFNVLGASIQRASDIVSYAFLLPLLTEMYKLMSGGLESLDFDLISKSILYATGIMVSSNLLKRMMDNMRIKE